MLLAPLLALACTQAGAPRVATPTPASSSAPSTPEDPCARAAKSRARVPGLLAEGRLDRALRVLDAADARCPGSARDGRALRVIALAEIGREAEAQALASAIEADPSVSADERGAAIRARAALEARKVEGALGCAARVDRGLAARREGDAPEARRRLDRALVVCARETGAAPIVEARRPRGLAPHAASRAGARWLLPATDEVLVLDAASGAVRLRLPWRGDARGGAPLARRSPGGRWIEVRGRDGLAVFDADTGALATRAPGGWVARDDRTLVRATEQGLALSPIAGGAERTLSRRGRVLDVGAQAVLIASDTKPADTAELLVVRFDGAVTSLGSVPKPARDAVTASLSDDGARAVVSIPGARGLAIHDARTGARIASVGASAPPFDPARRRFCFDARDGADPSGARVACVEEPPIPAAVLDAACAAPAPSVRALAESADGRVLAVATARAVVAFDRATARPRLLEGLAPEALALSLDGGRALAASGPRLRAWTLADAVTFASLDLAAPLLGLDASTPALARHPAGGFASWDGASLRRVEPRALLPTVVRALPRDDAPFALSFDEGGARVALGTARGVRVLDRDGAVLATVDGVREPALSPDGALLATTRGVHEIPGGASKLARSLGRPAFSPTGRWLAALDDDRLAVRLFDARTLVETRALPLDAPAVAIAFGAGDQELAVATAEGRVLLWSIRTLWPGGAERASVEIGLFDDRGAAWVRAGNGELEAIGDVDGGLACRFGHLVFPFALCEERFLVADLATRALAGEPTPTEP